MIPYVLQGNFSEYVEEIFLGANESLDLEQLRCADVVLWNLISSSAMQIVEREGLPHIAHLLCGWGNIKVNGRSLLETVSDFVLPNPLPHIPQNCGWGDFHPWQTFAYAKMAGLDFHLEVAGLPLYAVVAESNNLATKDATDLGHCLYTLARLPAEQRPKTYKFDGRSVVLEDLFQIALSGHIEGGYHVCRKFHLTEGLCALSSEDPFSTSRDLIQILLEGQLHSLRPLLALVVSTLPRDNCKGEWSDSVFEIGSKMQTDLRILLVMGSALENLYYYAGHLTELAAISINAGFRTALDYRYCIETIANCLNSFLPVVAPYLNFAEGFYSFAHYRRGQLLYAKSVLEHGAADQFTVADDIVCDSNFTSINVTKRGHSVWNFDLAKGKELPRRNFSKILVQYNAMAKPEYRARGEFSHFRKIMPPSYPRGLHFEFLDHETHIGVELHCESDQIDALPIFKKLTSLGEISKIGGRVLFDEKWSRGSGRVVIAFPETFPPEKVASAMLNFVNISEPYLTRLMRRS